MDQVSELIQLKSIKRKARFSYNFCHSFYESKLSRSTSDKRKVIYEALAALDVMYSMYETLKIGMRKKSYREQIAFAEKWNTNITCIEALIAYKTEEDRFFDGASIDEATARSKARNIYREFSVKIEAKKITYSN